jgi:hypothetical protein
MIVKSTASLARAGERLGGAFEMAQMSPSLLSHPQDACDDRLIWPGQATLYRRQA